MILLKSLTTDNENGLFSKCYERIVHVFDFSLYYNNNLNDFSAMTASK